MKEIITLKDLSNITFLGNGVLIAFRYGKNRSIMKEINVLNFEEIKEKVEKPENYEVLGFTIGNGLICIDVVAL